MMILGVELKRPSFWSLTSAFGVAIAFWAVLQISPFGASTPVAAGAYLVAMIFGCVSNAIGIQVSRGGHHIVLNDAGRVLVLMLYRVLALLI